MAKDISRKQIDVERFITKLKWWVCEKKITQIDNFVIDVYRFTFPKPIKGEQLEAFTDYIGTLNLTLLSSVMLIWVWLYQHDIQFRLGFKWNKNLSFKYNIKNIMGPMDINRKLSWYYVMAIGNDRSDCIATYRKRHPDRPGSDCFNAADCYSQKEWNEEIYPKYYADAVCRERLVSDTVYGKKPEGFEPI